MFIAVVVSDILITLSVFFSSVHGECKSDSEFSRNWFANESDHVLPKGYSQTPPQIEGCPVDVFVSVYPIALGDISVAHMKFDLDLFVAVAWEDSRLQLPDEIISRDLTKIPSNIADRMWTPWLQFKNCLKCAEIIYTPEKNLIKVQYRKMTTYWRRLESFRCDFDLSCYPMDEQNCYVEIMTTRDEKHLVTLIDNSTHAMISSSKPPEFEIVEMTSGNCTRLDLTNYFHTCVEFKFTLRRQVAHHIMLIYIPSMLIVALTWISFWLDVDATAPRVTLGLTTLLTLATQFSNAQKNLPPVAYMKAIDIWMVVCMFMVVTSLVEFAIAYWQMQKKKHNIIHIPKKNIVSYYMGSYTRQTPGNKGRLATPTTFTSRTDRISRIIFPAFFLIFNVIYWSYYGVR